MDLSAVSKTLFIPLSARIFASKNFPEYFYDEKALSLESLVRSSCEFVREKSSEYALMASAARYRNMDEIVRKFCAKYQKCNVVYLGAGLETACFRLKTLNVAFYEVDLPEVIEARKKVFGEREQETLIGGDMFKFRWADEMDTGLPTLLIVSGVFQYFHEEEVIAFIKGCKEKFVNGEMIFDATSKSGLIFTNWFIKRTGNKTALMYFGIDDSREFADKCGAVLLEERTFFPDALKILKNKLKLITTISMKVAESKKQVKILHLKL